MLNNLTLAQLHAFHAECEEEFWSDNPAPETGRMFELNQLFKKIAAEIERRNAARASYVEAWGYHLDQAIKLGFTPKAMLAERRAAYYEQLVHSPFYQKQDSEKEKQDENIR